MTNRTVEQIITPPVGMNSALIKTHDVMRQTVGNRMDPFLVASLFEMKGPVFAPHPHAGFAVATYILPQSETGFYNQDSTGFSNEIAPGEMHVTLAGSGLLHEESNVTDGSSALGFQIWIDIPNTNRNDTPRATHMKNEAIPVQENNNGVVRVLAGSSQGMDAGMDMPTAFRLIDVTLTPDGQFDQDLTVSETAYLHMISGSVAVGDDTGTGGDVIFTGAGDTQLSVKAGPEGARFVLFAGEPLHQEPVFGGSFVASSQDELRQFKTAFAKGQMGQLTAFADKRAA